MAIAMSTGKNIDI